MIDTLPMQARRGYISTQCKMLFKCDETFGNFITESISGAKLIPSDSVGDTTAGSLAFTKSNAIHIETGTSASTPLHKVMSLDVDLVLSTRKVLVLAAHIEQIEAIGTRVNIGLGSIGVLSVSFYTNDMHCTLTLEDGTNVANVNTDPDLNMIVDGLPKTIYVMWDGVSNTLVAKALDADGSIASAENAVDLSQTSGVVTAPVSETFSPANLTRLKGAHYYCVSLWELDSAPTNLDYKLAQWGEQARLGNKGAPDL